MNAIRELGSQFPGTRVVVVSGTYDALLGKLLRDEIDFMIGILKHPDPSFDFVESRSIASDTAWSRGANIRWPAKAQ